MTTHSSPNYAIDTLLAQIRSLRGKTYGEGEEPTGAISRFIEDVWVLLVMSDEEADRLRVENERLTELVEAKTPRYYQQVISQLRQEVAGYEAAAQIEDWLN
jgi:hypothetical protein